MTWIMERKNLILWWTTFCYPLVSTSGNKSNPKTHVIETAYITVYSEPYSCEDFPPATWLLRVYVFIYLCSWHILSWAWISGAGWHSGLPDTLWHSLNTACSDLARLEWQQIQSRRGHHYGGSQPYFRHLWLKHFREQINYPTSNWTLDPTHVVCVL